MTKAKVGNHNSAFTRFWHITNDLAGLGRAINLIWSRRCGVDLDHTITVQITKFNLMDNRIWFAIKFMNGETFATIRPNHRHHSLIVCCHSDRRISVTVNIANFSVSHSAKSTTEIRLPKTLSATVSRPKFHHRLGPTQRQHTRDLTSSTIGKCFMENVALRIFDEPMIPTIGRLRKDTQACWQRPRSSIFGIKHGEGQQ